MSAKELSDLDFARAMVDFFGARRAATLIGWSVLWSLEGAKTAQDFTRAGNWRTRYRVVADFRRFRDHLVAGGFLELDEPDGVEHLVEKVRELRNAA